MTPAAPPDLSIIVPFHNEAGAIGEVAREIRATLAGHVRYELILIDDGSTDASLLRAREAQREDPAIRVLRHAERAGKSAALVTGRRAARARWIQMLDGDGQNDPADVLALLPLVADAPADLGLLAGRRRRRNDGAIKWLSSRIANAVRRAALGDGTPDTGCGFKLIRTEVFRRLPFFDGMHRFLPSLVRRAGWTVRTVTVGDRPRRADRSKFGLLDRLGVGVVDLLGAVWLNRRTRDPGRIVEQELAPPAQEDRLHD